MNKNRKSSKALEALFQSEEIQQISHKLQNINQLNKLVANMLPLHMRAYCQIANIRADGTLILATESPVWKHQLRFNIDSILTKINASSEFPPINKIEVIVIPELFRLESPSVPAKTKPATPNSNSIESAQNASEQLSGTKLGDALDRLVQSWIKRR